MRVLSQFVALTICVVTLTFVAGCRKSAGDAASPAVVKTASLPRQIAVLPVSFLDTADASIKINISDKDRDFTAGTVRGVLANQLASLGYAVMLASAVDDKLDSMGGWREMAPADVCSALGADGVLFTKVSDGYMVHTGALDLFGLDAELLLYNRKGDLAGQWSGSAFKRKVDIPTGPLGLAATILGTMLGDPARKQMRMVIYELGWQFGEQIPEYPGAKGLPRIKSLETNVDRGIFGIGDTLAVQLESEPGLRAVMDVQGFADGIVLNETAPGVYRGGYTVRPGDALQGGAVSFRLVRPNGAELVWREWEAPVNFDGRVPDSVNGLAATASTEGAHLTWNVPTDASVQGFVVERGDAPVGGFNAVGKTRQAAFDDPNVAQGETAYYRVRSVDGAGNLSEPQSAIRFTMPRYLTTELSGEVYGALPPGEYLINGNATVPESRTLTVGADTRIRFAPGSRLVVFGVLQAQGGAQSSLYFEGDEWSGVQVEREAFAYFSHARFSGCRSCIDSSGGVRITDTVFEGGGIAVRARRGEADIRGTRIANYDIGLDLDDVVLTASTINFSENRMDVRAAREVLLKEVWLGGTDPAHFRVEGPVRVRSVLDAPWPDGRVVELEEAPLDPKARKELFTALSEKGVQAFGERRYGDAVQALGKALQIGDDAITRLYLAYAYESIGERANAETVLTQGIDTYPYEVRLWLAQVRLLQSSGRLAEALQAARQAQKYNPDNPQVKLMAEYLEQEAKGAGL